MVFRNRPPPPEPLSCTLCSLPFEHYCSEECRERAWEAFHESLCPGKDKSIEEPLLNLISHCKKTNKSNPLMINRIFASVAQKIKKGEHVVGVSPFQ